MVFRGVEGLTIGRECRVAIEDTLPIGLLGPGRFTPRSAFAAISASVTWSDVERLAARSELPVVLKGILTAEDARLFRRALRHGGIVVYENGADRDNAVLRAFLGYRIVRFEDIETTPDWNPQNKIRVQRLIAEKDGT